MERGSALQRDLQCIDLMTSSRVHAILGAIWYGAMSDVQAFDLEAVRTDGWFERIGHGVGSFDALCDILGERFFAFAMITGARITALTVDRRNPDRTLVDFVVGGDDESATPESQRLSLPDFRCRLVAALLTESGRAPPPTRDTDVEGLQLHIGVRFLLLAPLYGYSLLRLDIDGAGSTLTLLADGHEVQMSVELFQTRLRAHVREELERVGSVQRTTIDLAQVAEATTAAEEKNWQRVVQLLGGWPAPLAIFLRTPEAHALSKEACSLIAKALQLLGSAHMHLGEMDRAGEVYRLGIQYANDSPLLAAEILASLGVGLSEHDRHGEAIGPLRRAIALGAPREKLLVPLGRAFLRRQRYVAAFVCLRDAIDAGVPEAELSEDFRQVDAGLGPALAGWRTGTPTVTAPSESRPASDLGSAGEPSPPSMRASDAERAAAVAIHGLRGS